MHDVEIYIPVLLKFVDDSVIFSQEELANLENIKSKFFVKNEKFENDKKSMFEHCLVQDDHDLLSKKFKYVTNPDPSVYELNDKIISYKNKNNRRPTRDKIEEMKSDYKKDRFIEPECLHVQIYYYHHRVIFKYTINVSDKEKFTLRDIRSIVNANYKEILNEKIIPSINEYVDRGVVSDKGRVISYYSYLLLFANSKKFGLKTLSEKLGSLTFRMVQSSKNSYKYADYHYVRISIPSTIVYANSDIDTDLKVDLINSIYQYCLYTKKKSDVEVLSKKQLQTYLPETVDEFNVIDEGILTNLWEYLMDSLGGKTSDTQLHDISKKNFYYSIAAFILAIVSIIISVK